MSANFFDIENLRCSYDKTANTEKKVVLDIRKLEIPKGKVVFIVGESGCGKSTILETLGLMNNTVYDPAGRARFHFHPEEGSLVDCIGLWKKNKRNELFQIRKNYFSFIFQQTNLMRNFSIKDNAILPFEIKTKMVDRKALHQIYRETLDRVGLGQILNEKKTDIQKLSGGQQQRLAFVRAFMPDFSVLFGDEPTGNLDPENADKLMHLLYQKIHESDGRDVSKKRTAVIVSHTPELYNKYGDVVIRIQKSVNEKGDTYGIIDQSSVEINR